MTRILVLGGTTEASALAKALADRGADAVFSYAGRTRSPVAQPLPTRIGGFGGVDGLVAFLKRESITKVVDATHPFAAQMSSNTVAACHKVGVELRGFERAPWKAGIGDRWTDVSDISGAVAALPKAVSRVFLAIGKQNLSAFSVAPQHRYLLRLVDAPTTDLPLPNCEVVVDRGPFTMSSDKALLSRHKTQIIVSKNAGGSGARAKLDVARELGIEVIMIARPKVPSRMILGDLDQVLHWLGHSADLGV
ncbi:cobalt-precorrin-6A reductase [uncultured Pelagimonas sp.]|uniref:cobalt-precorrin-6A reductase n=1 Tax=uncultured Pelagimonas sp. TaxID=1618102 RepID=UPI00261E3239|nr:cobalt-precorrin-6A reductase [uncultured Pelagimonas sp.]